MRTTTTRFRDVPYPFDCVSDKNRDVRNWEKFRGMPVEIVCIPSKPGFPFICEGPLFEVSERWREANGFEIDGRPKYACPHMLEID